MAATKAELFERIRRDSWREGLSVRALARKYGVHRRLVREALTRAECCPALKIPILAAFTMSMENRTFRGLSRGRCRPRRPGAGLMACSEP